MQIYFDTNVIRYFSVAFGSAELPVELQEKIVLSPVSALELMSQLCDDTANQAFSAVRAMLNWLPEKLSVLDIPPIFIQHNVTGTSADGDAIFKRITNAFNHCLYASSPQTLRDASKQLRVLLNESKLRDAERRRSTVEGMRATLRAKGRKNLNDDELREGFLMSLAKRAGVHHDHQQLKAFVSQLDAYYRHETLRLKRAVENTKMNLLSKKRQNDLFDAEQLLYLAVGELCFLTSDTGFSGLDESSQAARIHIVPPSDLTDRARAQETLRRSLAV